jgi:hypothetical protein
MDYWLCRIVLKHVLYLQEWMWQICCLLSACPRTDTAEWWTGSQAFTYGSAVYSAQKPLSSFTASCHTSSHAQWSLSGNYSMIKTQVLHSDSEMVSKGLNSIHSCWFASFSKIYFPTQCNSLLYLAAVCCRILIEVKLIVLQLVKKFPSSKL